MTDQALPETPEEYGDYFTERIDRLNQRIEDFHMEVNLSGPDVAERFGEVVADLKADHERMAEFVHRLGESAAETWRDLRDAAERSYERLEGEVSTAWADVRADNATQPHEYREAARVQADSWRSYLDRLKLHARLGRMEARDAAAGLDDAYQRAKPELERAGVTVGVALEALREPARDLVAHLRRAAKDFSRELD